MGRAWIDLATLDLQSGSALPTALPEAYVVGTQRTVSLRPSRFFWATENIKLNIITLTCFSLSSLM